MSTRNKSLIITGCLILVCALIAFLVGGWVAKWDYAAFFQGPIFMWICILVGVYVVGIGAYLLMDWVKNKL